MFAVWRQFGQTAGGFSSFDTSGLNTDNEIFSGTGYSPPFSGRITWLRAYFSGNGQTMTARLAGFWASSQHGGIPASKTAKFTASSGSASAGGQTLNSGPADGTNPVVRNDETIFFGWWRDASANSVWSVRSSGSFFRKTDTSGDIDNSSGTSGCGAPYTCGDIQAYGDLFGGDPRTLEYGFPAFRANRR